MKANTATATDTQLIQESRQGDESAYGKLVERYQSLACSVAYNRCGDLAMSEDLAQEAFLQAWRKLADLKDVMKFKSWLCTIVRNLATRSQEQSARSISTMAAPLESVIEPTSPAIDPSERIVSAEEEQLVWQALAAIPENYREPMILFYREEQSVANVAEALELSPDAVKQRLSRGRKFLQEQLTATVQSTLEKSKPTQRFTSAVILGLVGAKTKTATAGVVASAAAKSTTIGTGLGGLFLVPLAKLPLIAWLLKTSFDEVRSPREKQLIVRFLVFWGLALIPLVLLMFASIGWKSGIESPTLEALIIPGLGVLYQIPMIISGRRMGKRIEQLRIEEKTDTPLRGITKQKGGSTRRLFIGSALLVACWPSLLAMFAGDWVSVVALLSAALIISLLGSVVPWKSPKTAFRGYGVTLCAIVIVGLGVMFWQKSAWHDEFSDPTNWPRVEAGPTVPPMKGMPNPSEVPLQLERPYDIAKVTAINRKANFWWMGTMQAMTMTYVILTMLVWKRVYGKQKA